MRCRRGGLFAADGKEPGRRGTGRDGRRRQSEGHQDHHDEGRRRDARAAAGAAARRRGRTAGQAEQGDRDRRPRRRPGIASLRDRQRRLHAGPPRGDDHARRQARRSRFRRHAAGGRDVGRRAVQLGHAEQSRNHVASQPRADAPGRGRPGVGWRGQRRELHWQSGEARAHPVEIRRGRRRSTSIRNRSC